MIEAIPLEEKDRDRRVKVLLIRAGITMAAGLILLLWPGAGLNFLAFILGLFILSGGLSELFLLFREKGNRRGYTDWILRSLQALLGLLFIIRPGWIISLGLSFLFVTAGVLMAGGNVITLLMTRGVRKSFPWEQILFLLLGLVLIFAPFFSATLFVRIIGGVTLIHSVRDLILLLGVRRKPIAASSEEDTLRGEDVGEENPEE